MIFDPSPVLFLQLLNVLHPKKQGFALSKPHFNRFPDYISDLLFYQKPARHVTAISLFLARSQNLTFMSLALYETIRERDLDMTADLLDPAPTSDSKGIRLVR